jgi:tetratricopeptide (TPR) repeat protein
LVIAREAVALAHGIDDKVAAWYTHDWLLTDLLELGRLDEVGREVVTLLGLAEELRQPYWMALSKNTSVTLSLLAARFEEAEQVIEETGAIGRRLHAEWVEFYSDMQLFALRREQGRMGELDAVIERWIGDGKNLGRVARLAAVRHMETGEIPEARRCFELVAAEDFAGLPRNNLWVDTLCNLADVCTFLGDEVRARLLMSWLEPYAGRCAALGDNVCRGSIARYLGMLSSVCERWAEADVYFDRALEMDGRIGAVVAVAADHYEFGRSLLTRDGAGDRMKAVEQVDAAISAADTFRLTNIARKARALRASA